MSNSQSPVIVALDFDNPAAALALAQQLDPTQCRLKVGKELFTRAGPDLVKTLVAMEFDIFLDLKFHDIPNTTAKAVSAAADLGVWMAKQVLDQQGSAMLLIAVTVLTSMDETDLRELDIACSPAEQVVGLARLAQQSGLDGVVCSAQEASSLKAELGADFKLITPGIRLPDSVADDQRRVVSPPQAMAMGSDYLVIGRPITQSANPLETLVQINRSLSL